MTRPLEGKVIIDLSHRLPGPVAGKLLASLGAKVIKIEDKVFKDPFIYGLFAEMDNSFPVWYEHINKDKEIKRFDFNSPDDQKKISELVKSADAVIMAIPEKVQAKLGVSLDQLNDLQKPFSIVIPKASKSHHQNMHDLNALALTGLLTLHAKTHDHKGEKELAPPFLPIAGINFGQTMALDLVATMLKAQETGKTEIVESFLFESTRDMYSSFWPTELQGDSRFLHNGLYPCYNIYKSSDEHFIVVACVEDKFWVSMCEVFKLSYTLEQRFETTGKIHKELREFFSSKTLAELEVLLDGHDICINLLRND
ncbi:CoA transferase [Bacteriovorax sp. Seq25_V]|uniref:CoA transferase n=1 Tax=Bacteriovorax sp. Seq25_V TaxID=1201288 RepID=UPI00038A2BB3|nr:CoA transferase [Bacteriovorax sp. Seq25_V]EQC48034.1 CoA-transferase family III protein [Bacteriovorax sp. Seq25_V]